MKNPIRVGIIGVSGYSGKVALELLLNHSGVRVTYASAGTTTGPISEIWPNLNGKTDLVCEKFDSDKACRLCDCVFLALPHTESMAVTPKLVAAGIRVIDLSADYRLKKSSLYKTWYHVTHSDTKNLSKSVYGLPELFREKIKKAKLLANPGCYPTAAILALAPLVTAQSKDIQSITIDAKSGVSGAGRKAAASLMYCEANENFKAYKVLQHQHTPEINQYLSGLANRSIDASFVAHLLPVNRGILETIYVRLDQGVSQSKAFDLYKKFYKTEPFVRVQKPGVQPELNHVVGTNYCDLGLAVSADKKLLVITSAIDNLVKGAAGQAVQNFNIMYGFSETEGLL